MWKPEHRRAVGRNDLRYPSDLTDAERALVEPLPAPLSWAAAVAPPATGPAAMASPLAPPPSAMAR